MGNFKKSNDRGRSSRRSDSGRFEGRSGDRGGSRGRGGFRGRDSGRSDRRPDMHDVTCDKCGRECQVPFRPTGNKPVLCSDCFRKNDSSGTNFSPRNSGSRDSQSGITSEQFNLLNKKLDSILLVLKELEIVGEDGEDEDGDEELEDEDEADLDNEEDSDEDEEDEEEDEETEEGELDEDEEDDEEEDEEEGTD